jgi:hypothetical protein
MNKTSKNPGSDPRSDIAIDYLLIATGLAACLIGLMVLLQ